MRLSDIPIVVILCCTRVSFFLGSDVVCAVHGTLLGQQLASMQQIEQTKHRMSPGTNWVFMTFIADDIQLPHILCKST